MDLHIHCSGKNLIAKFSFPKFFILNDVGISIAIWKVDIEIFDLFGDLFLKSSSFFLDSNNIFVGIPVSFDIL